MYLKEGTLLKKGEYKIIRFIASGGFGCTYEAEHLMLGKRVAIKEFFPKTFCNRESDTLHVTVGTQSQKPLVDKLKKKFIDEARSIAKLSHNGIVRVSDVFEENGTAYYVMDYIEGKSLGEIIKERGLLSEKETLKYIHQVCDALSYVHDKNRLHLDIKPANIIIDENGDAKLIDFGASKQYDEENGENTSTLIGKTPGYAPLEQMGSKVDRFKPATDIYALGATLYKCLSGKTPLDANDIAEGEELDPLPSNVSEPTKKAVKAAMEISSKKRPQSVVEFVSILDETNTKTQTKEETVYDTSVSKPSIGDKNIQEGYSSSSENQQYSDVQKDSSGIIKSSKKEQISVTSNTGQSTHLGSSNIPEAHKTPNTPNGQQSKNLFSKINICLGVLAAIILGTLCYFLFGEAGKESEPTNVESTSTNLANDDLEEAEENDSDDPYAPTLTLIAPKSVTVGEKFKVIYRLANGKRSDFSEDDGYNQPGLHQLSGPEVKDTLIWVDYTFLYEAVNEGVYTLPSATVFIDGEIISSKSKKISVQSPKFTLSSSGNINGHEYVDLGLPSGLKWATCNLGASAPEQSGEYFAWGEVKTKSVFDYDSCPTSSKNRKWLSKNGYIDNNGNLTLSHDAAHKMWGEKWRMPTRKDLDELKDNTTTEWTTIKGVKGRVIISKKNNNCIFLPASGWWEDSSLKYNGEIGGYWSSTSCADAPEYSYYLYFNAHSFLPDGNYRNYGYPIRPVSE